MQKATNKKRKSKAMQLLIALMFAMGGLLALSCCFGCAASLPVTPSSTPTVLSSPPLSTQPTIPPIAPLPPAILKQIESAIKQDKVCLTREQWVTVRVGQESRKLRIKQLKRAIENCMKIQAIKVNQEREKRAIERASLQRRIKDLERREIVYWLAIGGLILFVGGGVGFGIWIGHSMPK